MQDNFLGGCDPPEALPVSAATQLDFAEVSLGCLEVLWRVLPPCTAFLPPHKGCLLGQEQAASTQPTTTGGAFLADLQALARKADCLICPIFAASEGGCQHWTLLVLEREGTAAAAAAAAASRPLDLQVGSAGCPKCQGTSCSACNPATAKRAELRKAAEEAVLNPLGQADSAKADRHWQLTYFDSLAAEHPGCRRVAQGLADLLEPGVQLPGRCNQQRQTGASCGYWAVYFCEEAARRRRGEGRWTKPFSQVARLDRLKKVLQRVAAF